ncbi:MAG TPA: hypothetical protein VH253_00760 [Phycisphaerae bacterium]|nr:hypothetical protein [Phycisphaerae bacterium]
MKCCIAIAVAAAWAAGVGISSSLQAEPLNATNWQEHAFSPGGTETWNNTVTQSGSNLLAPMPTDTTAWDHSAGGGQGYDAVEHVAITSGPVLGDLSSKTGFTVSFSLTNSDIAAHQMFTNADFAGETLGGAPDVKQVLLFLGSTGVSDPGEPLSEWWYSPTAVSVTSMSNGDGVTISADFSNLSGWTNIGGINATSDGTVFQDTLKDVTRIGLSFGSGTFYSDGFGFTGNGSATGTVTVTAFDTTPAATPLPASAWTGLSLLGILGLVVGRKRLRSQIA